MVAEKWVLRYGPFMAWKYLVWVSICYGSKSSAGAYFLDSSWSFLVSFSSSSKRRSASR